MEEEPRASFRFVNGRAPLSGCRQLAWLPTSRSAREWRLPYQLRRREAMARPTSRPKAAARSASNPPAANQWYS